MLPLVFSKAPLGGVRVDGTAVTAVPGVSARGVCPRSLGLYLDAQQRLLTPPPLVPLAPVKLVDAVGLNLVVGQLQRGGKYPPTTSSGTQRTFPDGSRSQTGERAIEIDMARLPSPTRPTIWWARAPAGGEYSGMTGVAKYQGG